MPNFAKLHDSSTTLPLRVRHDPAIIGLHIAQHVITSQALTTIHEQTIEDQHHDTTEGRPILTRENPFLSDAAKSLLDPTGLIQPGSKITPDCVLASIIRILPSSRNPSERPPPGIVRAIDISLEPLPEWVGATVANATYRTRDEIAGPTKTNLVGEARITLHVVAPLQIGDVLLLDGTPATIAGIHHSPQDDILIGSHCLLPSGLSPQSQITSQVGVLDEPVDLSWQARSVGPYSLINGQPLRLKGRRRSQAITAQHVHTLRTAGLSANLTELLTIKTEDLGNRPRVRAALREGAPFPHPGAPSTLHIIVAELAALGITARPRSSGDHIAMDLAPMTDLDRLEIAKAPILLQETLDFRTYNPIEDGLFCEKIFGPENHPDRRLRFAHIDLPEPIVPYIFRMPFADGSPSVLAGTLHIPDDDISGLLDQTRCLDANNTVAPRVISDSTSPTGARAIEHLLALLPEDRLPATLQSRAAARTALVAHTVLVIPPDLRPLVLLESGNFATSDLNDLYRSLINRANRLRKLKQLNAPAAVILSDSRSLQQSADLLFANTQLPPAMRPKNMDRKLKDVLNLLLFRLRDSRGKQTDFSARARAIPAASIPPDAVLLPEPIARTLGIREGSPILLTRDPRANEPGAPILFLNAKIHPASVIGLPAGHFQEFFAPLDILPECILHRPLSPQALAEASRNLGIILKTDIPARRSRLDSDDDLQLTTHLILAARDASPLLFASPAGILLVGPGIPELSPPPPPKEPETPRTIEVPAALYKTNQDSP